MLKEAGSFFAIAFVLFVGAYVYIYSQGGNPYHLLSPSHVATTPIALDYHQLARQDALSAGISADLFERQIQQESGFNPNAVSQAGAIGIAQILKSTADSWHVNPWDPTASLNIAAQHMAWYVNHYGSYEKGLVCYNAGCGALDIALAECGTSWRACVPAETQRYITAIMGVQS